MRLAVSCVLMALALSPARADDTVCTLSTPCTIGAGSYLVHVPAGWDGASPLPAMVYYHGYRGSAAEEINNPEMIAFSNETGNLLIVPNGADGRWSFPGSAHPGRDEFAFQNAMLDDVEKRFPIDHARLWASGFSIGGSMTWYAACYLANRFAAFAPVAGSFWEPMPTDCPSGPANIRHIHGLADWTVPLEGRGIGTHWRQGDTWIGLSLWKHIDGCKPEPTRIEKQGAMSCRVWQGCASGRELQLCLHPGEHEIWVDWLKDSWRWVDDLANRVHAGQHASTQVAPPAP